ncbi:MAG TPA: N-acetyl-gamma-glutamyl-phosphate reductase [Syntrophales bacterium]|nr:N-acetyl-gamma-glutamyl-phosphate reductase [Syntrophales bacterium]
MIAVGIYGASGYTGQELMRLLLRHQQVEIAAITSRQYKGVSLAKVFPGFQGSTDLTFSDYSPEEMAALCDIVFLALPHSVSMKVAPIFHEAGIKIIDLSADFRIRDVKTYEKWYGFHTSPDLLNKTVYGIPELYRAAIAESSFIANPGCYPTSVILGLAPLLKGKYIDHASIIVDSKSGVSGKGREPQVGALFCEVSEGFNAYNVGRHRHTPEIEQELTILAGESVTISFTPHLLPVSRGILSTIYAKLEKGADTAELLGIYGDFYRNEKFVSLCNEGALPNISSVRGTNFCRIGLVVDERTNRVVIISAIDNLVKGGAGQAIQNMNVLCGFAEDAGLNMLPLFP